MKRKPNQWDNDAEYGSDILGTGQAWGDMRGKVKTKQIGFVRQVKPVRKHPTITAKKK